MEAYFEDKRFPVLVLFRGVRIGDAAEPVVVDDLNMKLLFVIDVGDRPNHLGWEAMDLHRKVKRLLAIHPAYDEGKLEAMKALKLAGLPPIRVVDCGDHYMAIEGSHRLAAAADLRIAPSLIVLPEVEFVELVTTDIAELFDPE